MPQVNSSTILSIDYDEDREEMTVRFRSGSIYTYHQVKPDLYREFLGSDSKGNFLHHRVKGIYAHTKK